jgi:subfamily B ATP-binding cassette protein MsbA
MMMMISPVRDLTRVNAMVQKGIAAGQSIYGLLGTQPEADEGKTPLTRARGEIELRSVSFAYDEAKGQVLRDVSLMVEPGKMVALVGRSGAGKSTILSLLPRFYDPQSGSVMLDGVDLREYSLAALREQIAYVSQDVVLFNDTIGNNIAYGSMAGVDSERIWEATRAAHAEEFIRKLPEGLDTMIGDNGVLLSGGQRQRIAIARALLRDAPVLLLDEATSSLDSESERHIQDALENLLRNRTTLVIAHRLSTVEHADRIIVMNDGAVVESGTHTELLAMSGHYARLHRTQFQRRRPPSRVSAAIG